MGIAITIYLISVIAMYAWTRIAYSENGIFSTRDTSFGDVYFTIVPLFNTTAAIIGWLFQFPYKHTPRKKTNYNKFFGIKRDEQTKTKSR